ncbi:uncharacterized protein IL334_007474 [Kwoniella shivajii]|uniref:Uncharacterized protein n=1 Tax=Kwoniella shivajii TaxID=564305 RepID=A0ABZ1DBX4_9TREE|nr:hypothetical protein IL334_007474 [Kwoniella shivajii]
MDYQNQNTHHHTSAVPRSPNLNQESSSSLSFNSNSVHTANSTTAHPRNISKRYPSPSPGYSPPTRDHSDLPLPTYEADSPIRSSPSTFGVGHRLLPSRIMRVTRSNAKTYLNLSIAFNILLLIAIFLPTEHAHGIIGDKAWSKVEEYGLLKSKWGSSSTDLAQAVMENRRGCSMCDVDPEFCEEFGEANLNKALEFAGSNNRLRRVLAKIRSGQPFTVGVIGGSVSKGHGLNAPDGDNPHTPRNLNRVVFDHLDSLFPAANGISKGESGKKSNKNSIINGAQGGMGTDYFSLCFNEHIPDDVDLVIIELAINDEVLIRNMNSYELLVRGLYDLPNKPAVINLHVFALMFQYIANGGDLHNGVAQYYDVPTISMRNPILPQVMKNTTMVRHLFHNRVQKTDWTDPLDEIDLRHLSWQGHEMMGKLGSVYIDTQLCEMDRIESRFGPDEKINYDELYPVEPLPRAPLMKKFSPTFVLPKLSPQCYSANGIKHPLKPTEQNGWRHWNWKEKHYLVADEPGSKVSFKVSTTLGEVQLHYLRSYQYNLGSARCWIDNDTDKAMRLDGYWKEPYNIGRAATIRDNLTPGDHVLHCELLKETADPTGGKEFRIISVMR